MLALTALAACQPKTEKVPAIDMTDLDLTVAPGDDFYRYANGGWMQKNPLKPEYARFGSFDMLRENNVARLNELFAEMAEMSPEAGVAPDEAGFAVSAELLRVQLKALVAQRLFGTEGYYRVVNRLRSEAFREAVSLLEAWEQRGRPLLENRK